MLARDRLSHLCDPDPGSVLELSSLAADGLYDGRFPGAGLVTAIAKVVGVCWSVDRGYIRGQVCGIWCAVIINEGSTMGGTWTGLSCEKVNIGRDDFDRFTLNSYAYVDFRDVFIRL